MNKLLYKQIRLKLIHLSEKMRIDDFLRDMKRNRKNNLNVRENERLDSAKRVLLKEKIEKNIKVGLVKDIRSNSYWEKFERFLVNNNIYYEFYDIHSAEYIDKAEHYDVIIWHPNSDVLSQEEAKSKIEFLQYHMNKKCLPTAESIWFYEDKIRQAWLFKINKLPMLPTFITYKKSEAINYISQHKHPLIFKESVSSGSLGVFKSDNETISKKYINKVFSSGRKGTNSTRKHKGYIYIQKLVENEGYDLRIIVIGDSLLGYYRYPAKNDFRASGAGNIIKKGLPTEAMDLARRVKSVLPYSPMLAVDFLKDSNSKEYKIIEASIFIGCETCEQLMVEGVPGRYVYRNGEYEFETGRFWLQELMLEDYFNKYYELYR